MLGVDALFASPAIPFPSTTTSSSSSSCSCRFSPAVAYAPRHPPGRRVLRRFDEVRACPDLGSRLPSKEAIGTWCNADAVCFDVDSTVCLDEGIHELADFCGVGRAVAEWTAKAMTGSVAFEEALAARLSLFKPSLDQVEDCIEKRPPRISPGIAELIKTLKAKNVDVYLVSGGFRQMIKPVALELGIPPENIFANQLLFGTSGEYVGFNPTEPTSKSRGKTVAVQHIRQV